MKPLSAKFNSAKADLIIDSAQLVTAGPSITRVPDEHLSNNTHLNEPVTKLQWQGYWRLVGPLSLKAAFVILRFLWFSHALTLDVAIESCLF